MINKAKSLFSSVVNDHFSNNDHVFKKILFNILTILLFSSIVLTMGFTRIFPLNYLLKISLLLTNILIIVYILFFEKIRLDKYLLLLIIATIWFSVIAIATKSLSSNQTLILNFANMIPMYLILTNSKKVQKTFYRAMIIGLLLYTFIFFIYYFKDILAFNFSNRLGSFFGNQNDVAATLLIASTLFFYLFIRGKFIFAIPFLVAVVNLFSTGSRAGLLNLGIILVFVFVLAFYKRNKKILFSGLVIGAVILTILILTPAFAPLKDRFIDMINVLFKGESEADASTRFRFMVITESIYMFLLSPVFGNFILLPQFTSNTMVAHNAFLELAAMQGVISLLLFIIAFIYPIYKSKKSNHPHGLLFTALIVGSVLFHLTLTSIPFKEQYLVLTLAMSYVSLSYVDVDLRSEFIKYKNMNKVHYLKEERTYSSVDKLLNHILFSKKQIIYLSPSKIEKSSLLDLLVDKGFNVKQFSFKDSKLKESFTDEGIYLIEDMDNSNVEHLKVLDNLIKTSSYKILILNDYPFNDHRLFNSQTYAPIFTKSSSNIDNKLKTTANEKKKSRVTKVKKGINYGEFVNYLFLVLFNILSIASFYFATVYQEFVSKVILVIFSVSFYFRVVTILQEKRHSRKQWSTKLFMYFISSLLPASIFVLSSFIVSLKIKLSVTMIVFLSFFILSILIPTFIQKKD